MKRSMTAILVTSIAATGCAIHPDPADYSGVSTHNIVRRVRCEARDEIPKMLAEWLQRRSSDDPTDAADLETLHRMGRELAADRTKLKTIRAELKRSSTLRSFSTVIETTMATAIAYHFEFDVTETNDLSTDLSLARTVPGSVGGLGLRGAVNRTRENTRTFDTSDSFQTLYDLHERYCERIETTTENQLYPIAGHIGLDKTLRTFFELTLTDAPDKTTSASGKPSTLGEQLVFTTKVQAKLTPSITYAPAGAAVQLTQGLLTSDNTREDKHKLLVYLAAAGDTRAVQQLVFASWGRSVAATPTIPRGKVDNETIARWGLSDILSRQIKFQLAQ